MEGRESTDVVRKKKERKKEKKFNRDLLRRE